MFKNLGKNILSSLIELEEQDKGIETPQETSEPEKKITRLSIVSSSSGAVDSKFEQNLLKALQESASSDFGYLKFKSALTDMQDDVPNESARYKAVFKIIKTMGINSKNLQDDIRKCLEVLNQQKDDFYTTISETQKAEIDAKETLAKNLETSVEDKNKTILKLQKEIEDATVQSQNLKVEIESSKTKLQNKIANFDQTLKKVIGNIKSDSDKIKLYSTESLDK